MTRALHLDLPIATGAAVAALRSPPLIAAKPNVPGGAELSAIFEAKRRRPIELELPTLKVEEPAKHAELEGLAGGSS
jgi:hypothetical protein